MNANEYGIVLKFGTGFDMSGNTSLSLVFTRPDGTSLTVTNPAVTVGSGAYGSFADKEYLNYTTVSGDINQAGTYTVRAIYNASGVHLISDPGTFVVNP